jgi:hypothetical protein
MRIRLSVAADDGYRVASRGGGVKADAPALKALNDGKIPVDGAVKDRYSTRNLFT